MSDHRSSPARATESLRKRAEDATQVTRTDISQMGSEEIQRLIHELQVHQIELQMQNEDLRLAQSELARSRDRYSELYDLAPVGYLTLDAEGNLLEANLKAAAMLGVERNALVGENFTRFVTRDAQDIYYLHRGAVLDSDRPQACELLLRRSDGTELAVRMESIRADGGLVHGRQCCSAIIDITARKAAEEELRHLNETLEHRVAEQTQEVRLLGAAVSHLAEGVVITGDGLAWPGPTIVFVNQAMCRITGYSQEELIGQTPRLLQGPATDRAVIARMRAELAAGRSCQVEITNYRKNGTPYPAEMFITPMVDPIGHHTHYVSIHRDITKRKRAEDGLTSLGRIVEDSLNEIYIVDVATMKFLQVNRGGRENLGYTMEELRQLTPLDLKPSFDAESFAVFVEPLLCGRVNKIDFESRHRRKDGSFYDIEGTLQMTDYRGAPAIVSTILDTTRRRELQQEVVKVAEAERQRIALDLHDDLGSLLTGLKLRVESMVGSSAEPLDGSELTLQLAREAITRTRQIARGLYPVGNDPEDLMSALHDLALRTQAASGIACHFHCSPAVLTTGTHMAIHLFRIAQEAVNNAVKHSGGSEIVISLSDTPSTVELEVSDNGGGFPTYAEEAGLGMHIMTYRADSMRGRLRIGATRSGGTSVQCSVPKTLPAV